MIRRQELFQRIQKALKRSRVVALLGPRQSGKTTIARQVLGFKKTHHFDLEDPATFDRFNEPMNVLRDLRGTVVIDEVQKKPEIFPVLRVLADRKPLPARFLILGSASPELIKRSSESLAGRVEAIDMGGFSFQEVGSKNENRLWLRGGFPLSFLAKTEDDSFSWRKNLIQSIVRKDIPELGLGVTATTMIRFWTMLAGFHGQIWNGAELARSLGISETTVRRYLEVLEGLYMIRQLPAWHENIQKRQVKSPKIYFRDTGLLHQLLAIKTQKDLWRHTRYGASWEGHVLEQILTQRRPDAAYFWATHNKAELDLLLFLNGRRIGIEMKRSDSPKLSASMQIAMKELKLSTLYVIYPGVESFSLRSNVKVLNLEAFLKLPKI